MTIQSQQFDELRDAWRYDPVVQRRLDDNIATFQDYVQKRTHHVALSRASANEYDGAAVQAADSVRTRAHNAAVRAAEDVNRLCSTLGRAPIAPVCPQGINPLSSKPHRNAVAHYAADVLDLDAAARDAMDLR